MVEAAGEATDEAVVKTVVKAVVTNQWIRLMSAIISTRYLDMFVYVGASVSWIHPMHM